MYFVAIVLYKIDALTLYERIHEAMLITVFGLIIAWIYSHLHRNMDTIVYTVMIVLCTICIVVTHLPNLDVSLRLMTLVVRFILTVVLVGVGVHVVVKQIKAQHMENFPLLYLFAFGYWVVVAYGF
ncbi:hypothetical protein [Staphylococcus lutrae]|uniref:hypothetical protein n=1 Tax=Staphylococcus lutrae TaxID=155085 RepID=UPI001FD51B19|nr:hypothetical protein [Staphylococcus lutrae]